jgi:hypothetical protein
MVQIYVDLDGVLADFDQHYETVFGVIANKETDNVDWKAVGEVTNFYANIPPMEDMQELWNYVYFVSQAFFNNKPIVLTGIPYSVVTAEANKRAWVQKHIGDDIQVIGCKSKDKCSYAKPGDVLIDDWKRYKHLWIEKGGVWITHTSAKNTIRHLKEMSL